MSDEVKENVENVNDDAKVLKEAEEKIAENEKKAVDSVQDIMDEMRERDLPETEVVEDKTEEVEDVETDEDSDTTEEVDEEDSKVEDEESTKKVEALKLPNRLIQAAKRNHLTDDEILYLGDNAEKVLAKLADRLDAVSAELGERGRKRREELLKQNEEKTEKVIPTLEFSNEQIEDNPELKKVQEAIDFLLNENKQLKEEYLAKEREQSTLTAKELDAKIDSFFDSKITDYPELGNSKELSKAELTNRLNIWEQADNIKFGAEFKGDKMSVEEALDFAFSIYESKNPAKVKDKLVKEAKDREKQLIGRPNSKKMKQPKVSDEKAVKAVQDVMNSRAEQGW